MSAPPPVLPIQPDPEDEWLEELFRPAETWAPVHTVVASDDEGDLEKDWLLELLGAHRGGDGREAVVEPQAVAPRGGQVVVEPVEPKAALPRSSRSRSQRRLQQGEVEPMVAPLGGGRQVVVEPRRRAALLGATATSSTSAARNMVRSRSRGVTSSSSGQVVFRSWNDVSEHMANSALPPAVYQTWTVPGQDTILLSGLKFITLPPPGLVGPWSPFDHAVGRLLMWHRLLDVITFKIGIASDTTDRWHNPSHGYGAEGCWHFMDAVLEGPANRCRELEMDLIAACRGIAGCQNELPGGEGINPTRTHMCRVYLVIAEAGLGVGLSAACQLRRQRARRVPAQSGAVWVRMNGDDMMSGC